MKYGMKMWKINQPIRKWPAAEENDGRCCAKRLCHNIHKQRYAAKVEAAKIYQNLWYYLIIGFFIKYYDIWDTRASS